MEQKQAPMGGPDASPEHLHKLKLLKQEEERKKNSKPVKDWVEVHGDKYSQKGGKVLHCVQMNSGSVYREYVGRESQCVGYLKDVLKDGKEVKRV